MAHLKKIIRCTHQRKVVKIKIRDEHWQDVFGRKAVVSNVEGLEAVWPYLAILKGLCDKFVAGVLGKFGKTFHHL